MRTLTSDAADPHALAAFWAEVLGCDVEDLAASRRAQPRGPGPALRQEKR